MPNEWRSSRLGDHVELLTGFPFKSDEFATSGVKLARGMNVKRGQFEWSVDQTKYWPEITGELEQYTLRHGDVLIGMDGSRVGENWVSVREDDLPCLLVQRVARLRAAHDLTQGFLKYLVGNPAFTAYVKAIHTGTSIPHISGRQISDYPILLPPVHAQTRIASILGSLDEKIELNRRMNRTLERMSLALFKSWFVDFNPVRAKAEGDPTAGGLPDHLAALFPDRLVDSELGEIPEAWEVKSLDEALDINPKRKLVKGTLAPFLEMSNMPTKGPSPAAWRMREMTSGTKFIKGDTLVARITPCLENGKTAFVDFLYPGQVGWGSTEYIVLRPKGDIPLVFAYLLARTESFRSFAIRQMTGSSGRQRVPPDSLSAFQLALPAMDSPLHKAFGDQVTPYFERISLSARQNRTLAGLRDTLLPKLLSGELEVPEAEAAVEEVV